MSEDTDIVKRLDQHILRVMPHFAPEAWTQNVNLMTDARAEIERLRAEVLEQARLLGMSGEREAKLLAEIERLRARVAELEAERKAFRDGNKYEAAP